jgi:histidinol phosphatase-like enzyme
MLLRAAREHDIDLSASWMIGDILHDVEAGNRAGCRSLLIDKGNETEWRLGPQRMTARMAPDLYAAALMIAAGDGERR